MCSPFLFRAHMYMQELRIGDDDITRALFERVTSSSFSSKKMKVSYPSALDIVSFSMNPALRLALPLRPTANKTKRTQTPRQTATHYTAIPTSRNVYSSKKPQKSYHTSTVLPHTLHLHDTPIFSSCIRSSSSSASWSLRRSWGMRTGWSM